MTFKEKYNNERRWDHKVIIMEIFHLVACAGDRHWSLRMTADTFDVSVGLVSENLKLARAIHLHADKLLKCSNRQDALIKLKGL